MTAQSPETTTRHVDIAIIGTGFSGLGMAARLHDRGITDYLIIERATDVGGTWRDNTYPGAACDIRSDVYSFSFAPNPDWSRAYSAQPEILDYLRRTASDRGLTERIKFGTELERAEWDAAAKLWRLTLTPTGGAGGAASGSSAAGGAAVQGSAAGSTAASTAGEAAQASTGGAAARASAGGAAGASAPTQLTARVLISGAGPLIEPSWPAIAGLESFAGPRFHSARWRHDVDLTGKRVAVIGTGASAIQFVPEVQKLAGQLTVFQRSAPWVMPKADGPTSERRRRLFARMPGAQRLARQLEFLRAEVNFLGFRFKAIGAGAQQQALAHLRKQVSDPALRAKLTPDYRIGCKRILLSNGWYPALAAPNAEVVTEGIIEVDGNSIVTADGTRREFDVIIAGTGFHTQDPPVAKILFGADGAALADTWSPHLSALRGTTVAGFPNLYLLIGPNTVLGHNSMIAIIEAQLDYVLQALDAAPGGVLDTRPAAQRDYADALQRAFAGSVWTTGGCSSYYLDASGQNTTTWPHTVGKFRRTVARFRPEEFVAG